jgi:hypothetical protein
MGMGIDDWPVHAMKLLRSQVSMSQRFDLGKGECAFFGYSDAVRR